MSKGTKNTGAIEIHDKPDESGISSKAQESVQGELEPELRDMATGEQCEQELREEVGEVIQRLDQNRRPTVDVLYVCDRALKTFKKTIKGEVEKVVGLFSAEQAEKIRRAAGRLPKINHALFYSETQYRVHGSSMEIRLDAELRAKLDEAEELERAGMQGLEVLEVVGLVPEKTVDAISRGSGRVDDASDLAALAPLLRKNWQLLAPLQTHQPKEKLRLTQEKIERMAELSTELREDLTGGIGDDERDQMDWRRQVIGLFHMLEAEYELLRWSVLYSFNLSGRENEGGSLVSLRGMHQVARRRGKSAEEPEPVAADPSPTSVESESTPSSSATGLMPPSDGEEKE